MDFGFYPPEINSGRMYSGPGSGPMLAAAQAWVALADELYTAASGYQSAVSELTSGAWSGPSSASMSAAAASFVEWLSATAAQAEESAAQAHAAAAGYETAFAMTVPPPLIAANRSLLAALVATNFFGQNTPAIAATEIQYAEMWAQDAVAMYGYAASSASATITVTVHSSRSRTPIPASSASQAAAVGQAAEHHGRRCAKRGFVCAASLFRGAASPAGPGDVRLGRHRDCRRRRPTCCTLLSNLITIFVSLPSDLALFAAVIPQDIAAGSGRPSLRHGGFDDRSAHRPDRQRLERRRPLHQEGRSSLVRLPGDHSQPQPKRRIRDSGGHGGRGSARWIVRAVGMDRGRTRGEADRLHDTAHHHERRRRARPRKPARQTRSTRWELAEWPDRRWPARRLPATPQEKR